MIRTIVLEDLDPTKFTNENYVKTFLDCWTGYLSPSISYEVIYRIPQFEIFVDFIFKTKQPLPTLDYSGLIEVFKTFDFLNEYQRYGWVLLLVCHKNFCPNLFLNWKCGFPIPDLTFLKINSSLIPTNLVSKILCWCKLVLENKNFSSHRKRTIFSSILHVVLENSNFHLKTILERSKTGETIEKRIEKNKLLFQTLFQTKKEQLMELQIILDILEGAFAESKNPSLEPIKIQLSILNKWT